MFERYTERARRALFFARYETSQLGHTSIETEHLLLGVIRERKGIVARILERGDVRLDAIRADIEIHGRRAQNTPTSVDVPFSADTKRILLFAAEEADRLQHAHIGPEHLLLAIFREAKCSAAVMLSRSGLQLNTVRESIVELPSDRSIDDDLRPSDDDSSFRSSS